MKSTKVPNTVPKNLEPTGVSRLLDPFPYRIVIERRGGDRYMARVPAFPHLAATSRRIEEAVTELLSHVSREVQWLRQEKKPLPSADGTFSGQLRLRMPRSLHERLSTLAGEEGISLNLLLLTLIAEGLGMRRRRGRAKGPRKKARLPATPRNTGDADDELAAWAQDLRDDGGKRADADDDEDDDD